MDLDLTHTVAALAQYDAGLPDRDTLIHNAETNEDVERWERAEQEAQKLVRLAFYRDTADRNSLEKCMIVDLAWLRELVQRGRR